MGENPVHIAKINNGNTNKIYKATLKSQNWLIVRIATSQDKLAHYLKEQWCSNRVRELGIPSPEVLEVGNTVILLPYMVVRETLGIPGNQYEGDRENMLRQIGEYASIIHQVRTDGYGEVFDWSSNQLSRYNSWKEYLDKELHLNEIYELYDKTKGTILTQSNFQKFSAAVKKIEKLKFGPTLAHGDFLPKNVILNNEGGVIGVIDWESAKSTAALYWDMATTLNNIEPEERDFVVRGYKLGSKDYHSIAREIDVLWIIKKYDVVYPAIKKNNVEEIEMYSNRLNEVLDQYKK